MTGRYVFSNIKLSKMLRFFRKQRPTAWSTLALRVKTSVLLACLHILPDDGRSISRNVAEKHYDSRHDKLRRQYEDNWIDEHKHIQAVWSLTLFRLGYFGTIVPPPTFLLYLLSNYHQTGHDSNMAQNLSRTIKVKSKMTSLWRLWRLWRHLCSLEYQKLLKTA